MLIAKFKLCVFYLKLAEISPRAIDVISIKFGSACSEKFQACNTKCSGGGLQSYLTHYAMLRLQVIWEAGWM